MTSIPQILSSPSSRRSARCSCWPLGSTLMRGVPPHASGWPGKDVSLCSCGFPDRRNFNADPILLSLPLGLWFCLLSSQFQWPVTFCTSSFMQPDCSSSLGSQLWIHPKGNLLLHLQPTAAFLRSQLPRLTQRQPITSPSLCSCFNHSNFTTSTLQSTRC